MVISDAVKYLQERQVLCKWWYRIHVSQHQYSHDLSEACTWISVSLLTFHKSTGLASFKAMGPNTILMAGQSC